MRVLLLLPLAFLLMASGWRTDFEQAKDDAAKEQKLILLNFSGSDWCGPCKRMERQIFAADTFQQFAGQHLVMVNADFPKDKSKIDKATQKQNKALARQYQSVYAFPYTVLINAEGKVLKTWRGYGVASPEEMIEDITQHLPGDAVAAEVQHE